MTREDAKKILPFIKAYSEGKTIQIEKLTSNGHVWVDLEDPTFVAAPNSYRIKPSNTEDRSSQYEYNENDRTGTDGIISYLRGAIKDLNNLSGMATEDDNKIVDTICMVYRAIGKIKDANVAVK